MDFVERLRAQFEDGVEPRRLTDEYFDASGAGFTGSQFGLIVHLTRPNEFTADDFAAVSTLSVTVPARATIYLLSEEGVERTSELLSDVPTDIDIWHDDAAELVARGGPAWQLWNLVRTASWPAPVGEVGHNDVGPTIASKLLAAKRPRLVPIVDSVVREALGPDVSKWSSWREALLDQPLRDLIVDRTSSAPEGISLLRRIDVVVWMRNRPRRKSNDA